MSADGIRQLADDWRKDRSLQAAVDAALDYVGFDADYVARVTSPDFLSAAPTKKKQIKDDLWGMIEFDWRSMRLIDSPLLQRLRRIKQLGFTYLTYPSAEHSRFGHALGVAHVVDSFIQAIDRRAADKAIPPVVGMKFVRFDETGLTEHDAVHAALLHDVGHLPFSHVPEKLIDIRPSLFNLGKRPVAEIHADANTATGKALKTGEILSLLLVLSSRFTEFYTRFVRYGDAEADEALINIACLISGVPPRAELAGIPELISSASVDADKVDYVNRDARNCGIPVGVDVARVFLRSGIVRATRDYLKEHGLGDANTKEKYLFVVNSSGLDTIDEIVESRAALYQRVYFHAVTRTAERLFTRALEENAVAEAAKDPLLCDVLSIWNLEDNAILRRMRAHKDQKVSQLAERLLLRNLPKRAYTFSPSVTGVQMPIEDMLPRVDGETMLNVMKQVNNSTIEEYLRQDFLLRGFGGRLEADILKEVARICDNLRTSGNDDIIPRSSGGPGCLIVVGTAREDQKKHNQIISQGDRLLRVSEYSNSKEQKYAFELVKEVGHVLCDPEWRAIVFFAARVAIANIDMNLGDASLEETYHGPIPSDDNGAAPDEDAGTERAAPLDVKYLRRYLPDYDHVLLRASLQPSGVRKVERALRKGGYFDGVPWACEPESSDAPDVIAVADKLKNFSGDWSWQVTPRSVAAFVSQFPPSLRSGMLRALKKIEIVDTDGCTDRFADVVASGEKLHVAPFSATSGYRIWYKLRQRFRTEKRLTFDVSLDAALDSQDDNPIILVDDNISSAVQARAQFLSWFNIPRDRWPEECCDEHDLFPALVQHRLDALRGREVRLWVSAARGSAEAVLRECLTGIGYTRFGGLSFATALDLRHSWSAELRDFLSGVGQSLVAWTRYNAQFDELLADAQADCRKNSFGYNCAGGLVATSFSVPTGTITPLWLPGLVGKVPWMPLLIRSRKLRHLVIA